MKKIITVLFLLLVSLTLISCQKDEGAQVDPAQAKLDEAFDALILPVPDDKNVSQSFNVSVTLLNGVTASWASDKATYAEIKDNADAKLKTVSITRPAAKQPSEVVKLTATLKIASELDATKQLEKVKTFSITVVPEPDSVVEVENWDAFCETVVGATIPADSTSGYYDIDGVRATVKVKAVTVIAITSDTLYGLKNGEFVYVYHNGVANIPDVKVGEVWDFSGNVQLYYGLYELMDAKIGSWGMTKVENATPETIVPTEVPSIEGFIGGLSNKALDDFTFNSKNPFIVKYVKVHAKVRVQGTGNYDVLLVDPSYDGGNINTSTPTEYSKKAFMVYYKSNIDVLRSLAGFEIDVNIFVYTLRSNNKAVAIAYAGDGSELVLSDDAIVNLDGGSIVLPTDLHKAEKVTLPTTGEKGSTIAWSYTESDGAGNGYINLTTGDITIPEEGTATIKITATLTKGTATKTINYEIVVGKLPVTPLTFNFVNDTKYKVQGIVYATDGYLSFGLTDGTNSLLVYLAAASAVSAADLNAKLGQEVTLYGKFALFNGIRQLTLVEEIEVVNESPTNTYTPNSIDDLAGWSVVTNLGVYSGGLVSATGLKVVSVVTDPTYGNITVTLLHISNKLTIELYYDSRSSLKDSEQLAKLSGLQPGTYINFTNGLVGGQSSAGAVARILLTVDLTITTYTLTAEDEVLLESYLLSVPGSISEAGTLVLPTTIGTKGATVAWASSNNEYINATTGAVTLPALGSVTVNLTATVTLNDVSISVVFVVKVGVASPSASIVQPNTSTAGTANDYTNNQAEALGLPSNFTVTLVKGTGAGVGYYADLRLYGHATQDGASIIFTCETTITTIVVGYSDGYAAGAQVLVGGVEVEGIAVEGGIEYIINALSFTIHNNNTSTTQVRIKTLVISYIAA
ncbi:MAG: hypothetical protein LBV58_01125 [Acholeplasmatales bacterium]|jgi:hypothetical protein|nr:hypothetical protein [Acholeplasmatales bacterium]